MDVIDTHTGGEPTRVIVAGGPDLGPVTPLQARQLLREHHDWLRTSVVLEPRGSDVVVAGLLLPPTDPTCCAGVVFMNNVGYLNMCGHGTIGIAVALRRLGRIGPGEHRLETPVGVVTFHYDGANGVRLDNVPSYRFKHGVRVGDVTGDIAWGGNWFFLTHDVPCPIDLAHVPELLQHSNTIRRSLETLGITGADGAEIDHIELTGPPGDPANRARNFVLCPGGAYDRSPCGTGTSAKVACLAAEGKLAPGDEWRQESVIGSVFTASYRPDGYRVIPTITGTAYVTAESRLLIDPADPLRHGIVS
ncbi:MAG: proline racemase family protein [Gemmataceae bacterium]|nr:proline racemase family protein [Gemmataceae bacterium]